MFTPSNHNSIFSGLTLATTNPHKQLEYSEIAQEQIQCRTMGVEEPAVNASMWKLMAKGEYEKVSHEFAEQIAKQAYLANGYKPILIENTLLFIRGLDGFPGPFTGDLDSDDARDMLTRHTHGKSRGDFNSEAVAIVTLAVYSGQTGLQYRSGIVNGEIVLSPKGEHGFGWDSVFIPHAENGENLGVTFAQMYREDKNLISMRRKVIELLRQYPFTKDI